ncbi:MAG: sarcosine oxidase subunit gamma [Gammaproteobacteria bacterium]|nr:sarcosine oxidase subunit gamma [Gammaproteobacteria bacterium]MDE2251529.1 sarcosine oxidase subunit gamma [Gammaproteobacteria bacterium]
MPEAIATRIPPPRASGLGWRTLDPQSCWSLRVELAAAAGPMATAGLPLALAACRAATRGEWAALWLGPDEQLLVGMNSSHAQFEPRLAGALAGIAHALVDVSHRQAAIEIAGPDATRLLALGCPLDLHLSQAPVGLCTRTVFAKAEVVLWRQEADRFQLQAWRSFLPYVTGLLALGSQELAPQA